MEPVDLGYGHRGEYVAWASDRELNPQYDGIPDVEKWGMIILHNDSQGKPCASFVTFAGDIQQQVAPNATTWDVQSWEPLTVTPSVLCNCGDHGFITGGRWIPT